MKACLISDENGNLKILCSNGFVAVANKNNLSIMLKSFQYVEKLKKSKERWDTEYPDMISYPSGKIHAYITDNLKLVINDFSPFEDIFHVNTLQSNMITVAEYAKIHSKSVEQIKVLCRQKRIPGAEKYGRDWMIPADAPYPASRKKRK